MTVYSWFDGKDFSGEIIPAGAHKLPDGAVKLECSNDHCPGVPYVHEECYAKWEHYLVDVLKRQMSCYRDMSAALLTKTLWSNHKVKELSAKFSTCPKCNGVLRRQHT